MIWFIGFWFTVDLVLWGVMYRRQGARVRKQRELLDQWENAIIQYGSFKAPDRKDQK